MSCIVLRGARIAGVRTFPFQEWAAIGTLTSSVLRQLGRLLSIAALAAVALSTPVAAEERQDAFEPLQTGPRGWVGAYLGKVAALGDFPGVPGDADVCTAVIVQPDWILTAAHCVYRKRADGKPWTPGYFAGMYPLGQLVFRPNPARPGPIYRIVDYRKSREFPDPNAVSDDWVFLKLDRPVDVDPSRLPAIAGPDDPPESARGWVSGFLRMYDTSGRLDIAASNLAVISRSACVAARYQSSHAGARTGLFQLDCIPPVNPGLSGSPLLYFPSGGAAGRAVIGALQSGAGPSGAIGGRVAVLVGSERFHAEYLRIREGARSP